MCVGGEAGKNEAERETLLSVGSVHLARGSIYSPSFTFSAENLSDPASAYLPPLLGFLSDASL